ncbi:MAG TPA: M28 family metallopeptidase [Ornithinibacter sp.]|nr:M28 family metallopeptidase [Ornithinibacter sp.]
MSRIPMRIGATVVAAAAATLSFTPWVQAAPTVSPACDTRVNNTHAKLMECITLEGVREHQAALQSIADANGGNRAAGTPGYDASVAYVVDKMEAAGYDVTLDEFPFTYVAAATLQQLTPLSNVYDTGPFTGTGYGSATGAVTPVDLALAPPRASTSGCEAADFAGFPAGNIALVQRGTCSFGLKAANAQAAGASAVIIFNQGNDPTREGLIVGTLLPDGAGTTIPVVGASFAAGEALSTPGSTAYINVPEPELITQTNVIAQSKWGNPSNVVMAGAHLDSVQAGPGINDNGSGSAAILEVAEQMAKVKPTNAVRFAWWGAEESGLVGSNEYVAGLSEAEKDKIALYLNFDMVGSPNHVFFVYDGDDSDKTGAGAGPEGSAQIEKTFEAFYTRVGEPFKGTDFSGRSDYGAFIANGIPSGGLFTGAEGVKTADEAALWGGTAGQQYDPCYHLACDTYANNNDHALDVNSDAIGFSVLQYAMNTSDINGLPGKGNFPVLSGAKSPAAGANLTGGGGLHDHDHAPTHTE